jgi:hypothetical protein
VLAVIALALVLGSVKQTVPYPPTRARDALRTISPYRSTGFAYVDVHDLPVDLVTPGPVRVLENYEVRLSGGYQGINGYDPVAAAHELDRACGTIAAIVGVDPQILAKALAHVDCQVVSKKVNRFHTAQVWDDTVILRLGPRAPRG